MVVFGPFLAYNESVRVTMSVLVAVGPPVACKQQSADMNLGL